MSEYDADDQVTGQQAFELPGSQPDEAWAYWHYAGPEPAAVRRSHRKLAIATGAAVVTGLAFVGWGVNSGVAGAGETSGFPHTAALSASGSLTASSVADAVDRSIVDVISKNRYTGSEDEGTGSIITSNGDVLTNNHVVQGGTSVSVRLVSNGAIYQAKVLGTDATHDVALIKILGVSGLPTISVGNSDDVKVGTAVATIGNALGKNGTPTVTTGTITGLNKAITASDETSISGGEQLTGLLETDSNIVSGDSGGPMVDSSGQVIGMDTAASADGSSSDGEFGSSTITSSSDGYAIPINTALEIAKKIARGEASSDIVIGTPGFLGVELATSSSGSSGAGDGYGDPGFGGQGGFGGYGGQGDSPYGDGSGTTGSTSGVAVAGVVSGSPAENAGITAGDTITAVDGTTITNDTDLTSALTHTHAGDHETITWTDSSGSSHQATVTLAGGQAA
jgi:S1-C subfamily serine protease